LNNLLGFARAGSTPDIRLAAWSGAVEKVRATVPAPVDPAQAVRKDAFAGRLFQRLYLDPASARGAFSGDLPHDPALVTDVAGELRASLENQDLIRSFPTRQIAVDALKALRHQAGLNALVQAKPILEAQHAVLQPGDPAKPQAWALIKRVETAIQTYEL
jgi:hypothetical protein